MSEWTFYWKICYFLILELYRLKQSCYYGVKAKSSLLGEKDKWDQQNSQNLSWFLKVGLISIILNH